MAQRQASRPIVLVTAVLAVGLFLGRAIKQVSAASSRRLRVGAEALRIVRNVRGVYARPPGGVPSGALPGGPVLGNGDMGVVLGGTPDALRFYIGKSDFFGVVRGYMMSMGSLRLSIPALRGASYHAQENIGPATVTGQFSNSNGAKLSLRAWVAAKADALVIQLRNAGRFPLPVSGRLLDAWGTPGSAPLRGRSGRIAFLRVSPDTVAGIVGNQIKQGPREPFHGQIGDVKIFNKAIGPSLARHARPVMAWLQGKGIVTAGGARIRRRGARGWRCALNGGANSYASLGMLRLPQRQFTLTMRVRATAQGAKNVIFAAQPSNFWSFGPQNYDGFSLALDHGRLRARLNETVAQARGRFPMNRPVRVTVNYNGRAMTIFANGREVARTTKFPTAAQVMGADKYSIHGGDNHIPYQDTSPKGALFLRALGGGSQIVAAGRLGVRIAPQRTVTLVVIGADNRHSRRYFRASAALLAKFNAHAVHSLQRAHAAWWKHFWQKSFIEIPDKTIQNAWYGSLYFLACCSAPSHDAPGLWGNFVTTTHPGWQGDYTLDYNYEANFWAAYPTNHVALARNYDRVLLGYMPRGKAEAKARGYQGIYDYTHMIPLPGWDADPSFYMKQKSGTLFACVDCVMRWRYTRNLAYARKVYPLLSGTARFWDHYLQLKNGVYVDANDAPDEGRDGNAVNPATSVAFLRLLYTNLIVINRNLRKNAARRRRWEHILKHLSPLPIVRASTVQPIVNAVGKAKTHGQWVIRQTQRGPAWVNMGDRFKPGYKPHQEGSSAGMTSLMAVFPGWQIGLESSPRDRQAALATARFQQLWYDFNNTSTFYPATACAGYNPHSILRHMHVLVTHFMTPNFALHFGGGGIENCSDVPAGICAMLLQSYQKTIHVFPDWPKAKNARFGDLLACGNFLVSSQIKNGRVRYVRIVSQAGQKLRLANPWPGRKVRVVAGGAAGRALHGPVLTLPTVRNEKLTFRPVQ